MKVTFLGSGDAFGSGGRLNTCFLVKASQCSFLIDCGASVMTSIRKFGVDPNVIDFILISHCHGDHFGGLPFFILDAQLVSRRARPLLIAGPLGLAARLTEMMEACFPGSSEAERKFELRIAELRPPGPTEMFDVLVHSTKVKHPSGPTDALALRISLDGKILAYTGDTEWVDDLTQVAHSADLLIAEGYTLGRKVRFHMDVETLRNKLPSLDVDRVILTHMSNEMLHLVKETGFEAAFDGLQVDV